MFVMEKPSKNKTSGIFNQSVNHY